MGDRTKFFRRFSLEQNIVIGFGLALAILATVGVLQYRTTQALIETDGWVAHTNAVRTQLEQTYSAIQQAEAGTRGFIATGNEKFLQQYQVGASRAPEHLRTLPGLIADDPIQRRNVDKLLSLAGRKIAVMHGLVTLRRDQGVVAASQELDKGVGLTLMNQIRELVDSMQSHENNLLQIRVAASRASARNADAVGAIGSVLALAIVFAGSWIALRNSAARQRVEERLRWANAYNRSLIEASLDPLVTIARDGKITDVNRTTEIVTGLSRQELIATDFCDYFTDPDRARTGYQQVFREGSVRDYELAIRHRDGHTTPVLYNASVYRDEGGQITGVFAAARDITERKQAEQALRTLNETLEQRVAQRTAELEASNKELEGFTYSVSHDLRAPLRHIDGFSRMLLEEGDAGLSDNARRYLDRIREGTKQMGQLVDDLLNLARLGRREMSPQVTGLSSLAEEAVGEMKKENPGRSIEWKVGPLPFVECDPGLMKQVFVNLLSNAVKYTRPRSAARIEVGALNQDDQTVIFVRDNGVGFSMKYADKLFGVFQRLHRPEDFEGTGIGLATVQRILHRHGGRAWAEAELDKGATFYFTLGGEKSDSRNQKTEGGTVTETAGAQTVESERQAA